MPEIIFAVDDAQRIEYNEVDKVGNTVRHNTNRFGLRMAGT